MEPTTQLECPTPRGPHQVVRLSWLVDDVFHKANPDYMEKNGVLRSAYKFLTEHRNKVEPLACGAITYDDALTVFKLKGEKLTVYYKYPRSPATWMLGGEHMRQTSDLMKMNLARLQSLTEGANMNETSARMVIDQVIQEALAQVMAERSKAPKAAALEMPRLVLTCESTISHEVMYKGRKRLLNGVADYCIKYIQYSKETSSNHVVVIKAKRCGCVDDAISQLVSYMGMVHREHQGDQKINAVVYGMATDSSLYQFYRIDHMSTLSSSRKLELRDDQVEIVSYLFHAIYAGFQSSPSSSPLINEDPQEDILETDRSGSGAVDFDYNIKDAVFDGDENCIDVTPEDITFG